VAQKSREFAVDAARRMHRGRASIVTALIGVALSFGGFELVRRSHVHSVETHFERSALDRVRAIEEEVSHYVQILRATGAYVESSPPLSRTTFANFASSVLEKHPGVGGLAWVVHVQGAQRAHFRDAMRQELPSFKVTELGEDGALVPAGFRSDYFPVVYIEPQTAENQLALGYDLASNPVRRRALERAVSTGRVSATARIRLVQEAQEQFSVLIVHPVYGSQSRAPEARLEQAVGFVTEVVRVRDLVDRSLERLEPGGIDLSIRDVSHGEAERLLYFHPSRKSRPEPGEAGLEEAQSAPLRRVVDFEIAGRRWQVVATAAPGSFSLVAPWQAWNALVLGLALTALLVAYLQLVQRQSSRQQSESNRLKQRVAERTEELEQVHRDLLRKERLATLGQLTATMAHEIRNPLSSISMSFELMWHKIENKSGEVERALLRAQRNIERCEHIITELLDFTRARGLEAVPIPLDVWLANLLDEYSAPGGVTILRDFATANTVVELDPHLMRRAVVNLLDNACQAAGDVKAARDQTGQGPGKARVRVETHEQADRVVIVIEDNGPGIPDALREEVFEPLFSTKSFGVGLGLATVRRIVEQHAGELSLEAAWEHGTRAVVSLHQATLSAAGELP